MWVNISKDIQVLEQLEKKTGKKFIKSNLDEITRQYSNSYSINVNRNIIGLSLYFTEISDYSFLKNLTNLVTLGFSWNQISDISFLKDLTNLTTLDLRHNQNSDISFIKNLTNLTELNLSRNQISDYSFLKNLTNLTKLDLSNNQISDILFLKNLTNLTKLVLYHNQISDISFLKDLTNLTSLDLSGNQISDISFLKDLTNLTSLDLSGNQISDISFLKDLTNLTTLELYRNMITHFPIELLKLNIKIGFEEEISFSGMNLYNNPLESPPIEFVKKGRDAILAYFKSLEGEKQPLNEVKVLLVGEGGAGKTSLVKRLIGEQFNEKEPSTHGINIRHWEVKERKDTIKVHFWDFGGQEIMHATHQFFLSKRSLYVLVLDGRREDKTEYWLKHIESFGGNSPVLIILNKTDENLYDLNRSSLLEKYKGIKGFYRVSCKNGDGFDDFKNNLGKELTHVELRRHPFSKNWLNVKTKLENMGENFIGYDGYTEMCLKEAITDKSAQDTLLGFLNDLGVILHFKELGLRYTHILEPKWLTGAVYKIINSKKLAENNGVLKLMLLDEILKQEKNADFYYPPDKYKYIIDIMKKFELCYPIDAETLLLPNLLDKNKPDFDFDYSNSLKFLIKYDFFPNSIMPRFIVRSHKDIRNQLRWRSGVVLEDKAYHSTAVIESDEEKKNICIYVNGEQKRDYFSTIRKTFRDINNSFEKLDFKEMVPLPDNEEIAIEYDELVGYEFAHKEEYFIGKLHKGYSVKRLLDGIEKQGDRMNMEDKKHVMYIDNRQYQSVTQEVTQKQDVKQEINIDIKIELPSIQSDFGKFKREVAKLDEDLRKEIEDVEDELLEVTPKSEQSKINKAMNKLSSFMQELGDENSKFSKIVKGSKKGVEYSQKLGKTYNKFAQWLALPQVPDLFLG